jgi:hypothetical protein
MKQTGLLDSLAPEPRHSGSPAAFEGMIGFRMASFSWTDEPDTNFKLEVKNELIFRSGTINLITGPTGSGARFAFNFNFHASSLRTIRQDFDAFSASWYDQFLYMGPR